MKCRKLSVLLAGFSALGAISASAQAPTSCGNSADADIVVMIDNTHSIKTDAALNNEKNAAKALLGFFGTATGTLPRVAIGTFNLEKSANACKGDPSCKARILPNATLTSNYGANSGAGTGLFAAINSISNPGGTTDLEAAISTAQAELAARAVPGSSRYIIIVTDGFTSDKPDPSNAGECSDAAMGTAAAAAADDAEAHGTKIFAVHFGGNNGPCLAAAGRTFLASSVATSLAYYFEGNADLPGIFTKISQSIVCNDNNSGTADSCNIATHKCEYTPIGGGGDGDDDGDGTPNGADGCSMDPFKTAPGVCGCGILDADTDNDGIIECIDTCLGGTFDACGICTGNGSTCTGCDGVFASNKKFDKCGVCGGDGTSCLGCTQRDLGIDQLALDKAGQFQWKAVYRIADHIKKKSHASKKTLKQLRKNRRTAKRLYMENNHFIFGWPKINSVCTNTILCVTSDYSSDVAKFTANAKQLQNLARNLYRRLKKSGGDKRILKMDKRLVNQSLKKTLAKLAIIPMSTSICTL